MQPYQTQYADNVREIAALRSPAVAGLGFEEWYARRKEASARIDALRKENIALLEEHLFPLLDDLHNAGEESIRELEEFASVLMDWTTNLDCGIYVLIHDSLLSLYRFRRDRDRIIKELYLLGMGLYYQRRRVLGIREDRTAAMAFENEMVFTEAGAYLKFFEEIESEETRGYIIRSLANIGICARGLKKRVAVAGRVLKICRDDYYRSLAPNLPWDVFLRRTNQQMSSCRAVFSKGDLSTEELAAVLESCHTVFQPESGTETPNIRWLWPYYEMEYSCGFVDLETTLDRMETLIERYPADVRDMSGLYGNVQLPVYYGRLLRENPGVRSRSRRMEFLVRAYGKMLHILRTQPTEQVDDFFSYLITLVASDYFETEGVPSYRETARELLERFGGLMYLRARRVGAVLQLLCGAILKDDPGFFDDIPFLAAIRDPGEKAATLDEYAMECGLFHDFGLIKMNFEQLQHTRNLLESEFLMYQLHTVSGRDDLKARASTERFADVALGHHAWYNGAGGYPEHYVRTDSAYRQMTDTVAAAVFLCDSYRGSMSEAAGELIRGEGTRFSPLVTAYLADEGLLRALDSALSADDMADYAALYKSLSGRTE